MSRSLWLRAFLLAVGLGGVPGCDRRDQPAWEVAVENKGDVPCSFAITLGADGGNKAHADGVNKGKRVTVITGPSDTVVHTVKIVRGPHEQAFTPHTALPVGKRYLVVVAADGTAEGSVVSK